MEPSPAAHSAASPAQRGADGVPTERWRRGSGLQAPSRCEPGAHGAASPARRGANGVLAERRRQGAGLQAPSKS